MILIADSGSTKTTWVLFDKNPDSEKTVFTSGINPYFQNEKEILDTLKKEFSIPTKGLKEIYFYGAGCANSTVNNVVKKALADFFGHIKIEVDSDLMAAARSLCGHNTGIACILGTGSNSCYYNGQSIEQQISPLGFILGDEGSGGVLGKRLLADVLKNQLPQPLIDKFYEAYKTTRDEIMENIYRKPFPNRYAAGFTRFLSENIQEPVINRLVANEFGLFLNRNVLQYPQVGELPIHFTGSVAWYFQDILKNEGLKHHLRIGKIVQDPIQGLLEYHQDNIIND